MFISNILTPTIGQGAFVIQEVSYQNDKIRIIFDCGSLDKGKLRSAIEDIEDRSIPTILVISHFHKDHINGVAILKELGFNIEKLIIPNYKIKDKVLFSTIADDNELTSFIFNPDEYFSDANTIRVDDNFNQGNPEFLSDALDTIGHHQSYSISQVNGCQWKLKFYVNTRIYLPIPIADKKFISRTNIDNLEARQARLKEIYSKSTKGIKYGLNKGSMITASFCDCSDKNRFCYQFNWYPNSILSTGDYPIDSNEASNKIATHFKEEQHKVFWMTVPHHGGRGYLKYLPLPFIRFATIQAGNRYGHPSKATLDQLKKWKINYGLHKEQ